MNQKGTSCQDAHLAERNMLLRNPLGRESVCKADTLFKEGEYRFFYRLQFSHTASLQQLMHTKCEKSTLAHEVMAEL
jgi:hypothetical protein